MQLKIFYFLHLIEKLMQIFVCFLIFLVFITYILFGPTLHADYYYFSKDELIWIPSYSRFYFSIFDKDIIIENQLFQIKNLLIFFSAEIFCLFWILFLILWGSLYTKINYTKKNFQPEKVFLVSFWLVIGILISMLILYFDAWQLYIDNKPEFTKNTIPVDNDSATLLKKVPILENVIRSDFPYQLEEWDSKDFEKRWSIYVSSKNTFETKVPFWEFYPYNQFSNYFEYQNHTKLEAYRDPLTDILDEKRKELLTSTKISRDWIQFFHFDFYPIRILICGLSAFLFDSYSKTVLLKKNNKLLLKYTNVLYEYPIFFLFSVFMCNILLCSVHLILIFLTIIGISLSLYALIAFDKNIYTIEAATKYFTAGALSSGFLLFGFFSFYYTSGTLFFDNLEFFSYFRENNINYFNFLGLISFFLGIFFKLSIFPCHLWAPDVYDGSALIVTAFLMTIVKISIFFFLVYFLMIGIKFIYFIWKPIFVFSGFFSVLIGTFGALYQNHLKRFFAFTSMSQLGLSILALGLFYENTFFFSFSILNFLVYIFGTLIFFLVLFRGLTVNVIPLNTVKNIRFSINRLGDFNTHFSFLLTLNILSMAGIPPLLGFFSKYLILSFFYAYSPILVFLLLLLHLVNTFNYLRLIQIIWFKKIFYFSYFNLIFFIEDYKEEHSFLDGLTLINIFLILKLDFVIKNFIFFIE